MALVLAGALTQVATPTGSAPVYRTGLYLDLVPARQHGATGRPWTYDATTSTAPTRWCCFDVPSQVAARVADQVVLLVDDRVGSRWTMTVAARLLRRAGARTVLPFALAVAG